MQWNDSSENTLMLRKIECGRRRGWQRMGLLDGITNSMDMSLSMGIGNGQRSLACCSPSGCKESDTTEWLNWIEWTSACMLNKQCDNIRPWCISFQISYTINKVKNNPWKGENICKPWISYGICICQIKNLSLYNNKKDRQYNSENRERI